MIFDHDSISLHLVGILFEDLIEEGRRNFIDCKNFSIRSLELVLLVHALPD